MRIKNNYKATVAAAFLGYITQAIMLNFPPLLFVFFGSEFGITPLQITALIVSNFVLEIIVDMQSSSEVLEYSNKITASKCDFNKFLSVMELLYRDLLVFKEGKQSLIANTQTLEKLKNVKGYKTGSIINALEKITQATMRKKFNANATMLTEWLLFQILEGKYKWQKL